MLRISSGTCGWSGCSEDGVGDGGFSAESGLVAASRWVSSVRIGSGRVVVADCWSCVMWVSAGLGPSYLSSIVVVVVGSTSWSSVVGALLVMAVRRSSS